MWLRSFIASAKGFWVSTGGSGDGDWLGYDIEAEHRFAFNI